MTHAVDSTVVQTAMELLSREGFEGFPEALKLLLNEAGCHASTLQRRSMLTVRMPPDGARRRDRPPPTAMSP